MFDGPWESCMGVRGLNPSECASWVQAWGSIAAIAGAVWIASRETRRLRKADRAAASVVAATVSVLLAAAMEQIEYLEQGLTLRNQGGWFSADDHASRLRNVVMPSEEQLLILTRGHGVAASQPLALATRGFHMISRDVYEIADCFNVGRIQTAESMLNDLLGTTSATYAFMRAGNEALLANLDLPPVHAAARL